MKSKTIASWHESSAKHRECVVKQRHYSAYKSPYSQGYGLPSGHERLWELDHKEGRMWNNWHLWTMPLKKTPDSPLDRKEIKPVSLKGDQPWISLKGLMLKLKFQYFLPDANRWLIGKVPVAGKDQGQKEKRMLEDEMAGWHHQCNEYELLQTLGDGKGQAGLPCCNPWGHKEVGTTGSLDNNRLNALMKRHCSFFFFLTLSWSF